VPPERLSQFEECALCGQHSCERASFTLAARNASRAPVPSRAGAPRSGFPASGRAPQASLGSTGSEAAHGAGSALTLATGYREVAVRNDHGAWLPCHAGWFVVAVLRPHAFDVYAGECVRAGGSRRVVGVGGQSENEAGAAPISFAICAVWRYVKQVTRARQAGCRTRRAAVTSTADLGDTADVRTTSTMPSWRATPCLSSAAINLSGARDRQPRLPSHRVRAVGESRATRRPSERR
jgi:hypothetical protein